MNMINVYSMMFQVEYLCESNSRLVQLEYSLAKVLGNWFSLIPFSPSSTKVTLPQTIHMSFNWAKEVQRTSPQNSGGTAHPLSLLLICFPSYSLRWHVKPRDLTPDSSKSVKKWTQLSIILCFPILELSQWDIMLESQYYKISLLLIF